jgi:hypothetical protein
VEHQHQCSARILGRYHIDPCRLHCRELVKEYTSRDGENIRVMSIDARFGNLESSCSKLVRPSERTGIGMVGSMNIVLFQDLLTIRRNVAGWWS